MPRITRQQAIQIHVIKYTSYNRVFFYCHEISSKKKYLLKKVSLKIVSLKQVSLKKVSVFLKVENFIFF